MANFKSKAKKFWENHKAEIIMFGVTVSAIAGTGLIATKSYQAGFVDGGVTGWLRGIQWLDEKYPGEYNGMELYGKYVKEHPDEMVKWKGPGKWS